MQLPFNDEDPAEAQSLAEAARLAVVIKDISERFKLPVNILTSRNARATDIAAIVSIANGLNISIDDRLTCVNYPDYVSDEDLIGRIGENNNRVLIWDKRIVYSVCGDGTYAQISKI